jgi:hypothetical protein
MMNLNSLADKIKAYVEIIEQHLIKPVTTHRRESSTSMPHWPPPPDGTIFVSVDATMFASSSKMRMGVVIGNHIDMCLLAIKSLMWSRHRNLPKH